jgi:hypothetical protein
MCPAYGLSALVRSTGESIEHEKVAPNATPGPATYHTSAAAKNNALKHIPTNHFCSEFAVYFPKISLLLDLHGLHSLEMVLIDFTMIVVEGADLPVSDVSLSVGASVPMTLTSSPR